MIRDKFCYICDESYFFIIYYMKSTTFIEIKMKEYKGIQKRKKEKNSST